MQQVSKVKVTCVQQAAAESGQFAMLDFYMFQGTCVQQAAAESPVEWIFPDQNSFPGYEFPSHA